MGYYDNALEHHGIRGQKWGVRRFETEGGHLTAAGKARYDDGKVSAKEKNAFSAKAAGYRALSKLHSINKATAFTSGGRKLADAGKRVADREAEKAQKEANARRDEKEAAKAKESETKQKDSKKMSTDTKRLIAGAAMATAGVALSAYGITKLSQINTPKPFSTQQLNSMGIATVPIDRIQIDRIKF